MSHPPRLVSHACLQGEEYFGWWASDTRSGLGAHLWPDGSKYEGEWAFNEQHGRGRYIWSDGMWRR